MCGNTSLDYSNRKKENLKIWSQNVITTHALKPEREEVDYVQQPPIELAAALIFLYNLQYSR